jgi:hypothetical protein
MAAKRNLLVEGTDDRHVTYAILKAHGLDGIANVVEHKGKAPLMEAIPVRLKESDTLAVGIVLDADTDCAARWVAIRHRLIDSGYTAVPPHPDPAGTIVDPPEGTTLPRAGVWIMPDNRDIGILEHFCAFLIPEADALRDLAHNAISAIPAAQQRFRDVDRPKALIHTWLSWQREPGTPLGQSINARFLDASLPAAVAYAKWLKRLFAD